MYTYMCMYRGRAPTGRPGTTLLPLMTLARPCAGLISEAPRSGRLSLAFVSAKELKERAFQGAL